MARPVELVPLACPKCGTSIPADVDEVAWACAQCGQGVALEPQQGLVEMNIYYSSTLAGNAVGKPYWVVNGQAAVQRDTYKGDSGKEAVQFWSQPRRFLLPAYSLPLEDFLTASVNLLLRPPNIQAGAPCKFLPVKLLMRDIQPAAEFVVMAVEAGRKDMMKSLAFELKLSRPALWIL